MNVQMKIINKRTILTFCIPTILIIRMALSQEHYKHFNPNSPTMIIGNVRYSIFDSESLFWRIFLMLVRDSYQLSQWDFLSALALHLTVLHPLPRLLDCEQFLLFDLPLVIVTRFCIRFLLLLTTVIPFHIIWMPDDSVVAGPLP